MPEAEEEAVEALEAVVGSMGPITSIAETPAEKIPKKQPNLWLMRSSETFLTDLH